MLRLPFGEGGHSRLLDGVEEAVEAVEDKQRRERVVGPVDEGRPAVLDKVAGVRLLEVVAAPLGDYSDGEEGGETGYGAGAALEPGLVEEAAEDVCADDL